ncbi:MAG TPA: DUF4082 domain-containing protein [Longimicrobium sp.]
MRLRYLAVCASLLATAACDGETKNPVAPTGEASRVTATANPRWSLYSSQTPTENLDATGGWEVGTRFTSSARGKVVGFRFYRAAGETGTNYGRLWTNTGTKLKTSNPFPSGTGWVTVMLDNPVEISANTTYRVSVNTNTRQAKTGGGYAFNGPLSSGPLYSDGGYYGQPAGSFPTSSSASYFFIDVIFEEYVAPPAMPDLYIGDINPFDGSNVYIRVCNNGTADAGASYTRLWHWVAPLSGGNGWWKTMVNIATPPIPAGQCVTIVYASSSYYQYRNEYHVDADIGGVVAESIETNNRGVRTWEWR